MQPVINANKRIIVFGGTGHYGRNVVAKLVSKGALVRVVSRNAEKARQILGSTVEILEGDITNRATITKSLKDIQGIVICLSAMNRKQIKQMEKIEYDAVLEIMDEAKKANVKRFVYMSGYEIREELLHRLNILDFGKIKLQMEKKISASDFNWTILGDAPSYEIFFAFIRNGKMAVPGGGMSAIPCISSEDVGEITAQTALRDDLNGQRIKLTGPRALTFPQAAEIISKCSGRKIDHVKIPLFVFRIVAKALLPVNPFINYLYKSLKMLNNFPVDLADDVPQAHRRVTEIFNYFPASLEQETGKRMALKIAPFTN